MFLRTVFAAFVTLATLSSAARAGLAQYDQLSTASACTYGFASQSLIDTLTYDAGTGPRAADDFVAGQTSKLRFITVRMIGRGVAGSPPSNSKFGVSIFANDPNGTNKPGALLGGRIGATSVVDRGPAPGTFFGAGFRCYDVNFEFPSPYYNTWLQAGKRYWVSGYGRVDNANWWYAAAHNSGGPLGTPCHSAPRYGQTGWYWYNIGNFSHNKLAMRIGY